MAKKQKSLFEIFTAGFVKENPVLRLVLGTCPTLAVTTMAFNGLGMGLAATAVLICSNALISALRKIIPDKIHIPVYITIIAAFVSVVQMLVKAFVPALDSALGIFLPLIVVNCIILGRAESFAGKNKIIPSIVDGVGMGLGFTIALVCMGSIREIIGAGTWFGIQILPSAIDPMLILILAPGGFFVFGVLMACANKLAEKKGKAPATLNCAGCPASASCGQAQKGGCE
ncbi:MAG: electron transport complex subunit E [Frisingicoccus sp.]|uniref:electron transport complex subunit RsxE n=2 Tax=Frisingicoccus sp. TaxID=1918627 RepID=UPI0026379B8D|nr:electron transport complex subunit E [Frisingicoccus sp.]MDD6231493.1 electron transport complex subunit E [Frisingicoccus sp.]MDY4835169.1 electron transport complex subunit E [Frisingicoccus sp.]